MKKISFNSHFATTYSVLISDNHSELYFKYIRFGGKQNKTTHQQNYTNEATSQNLFSLLICKFTLANPIIAHSYPLQHTQTPFLPRKTYI